MKPLKLVLSGWGPYKDTQSVDFTPIQAGGLFLITGATGAGKTTIFDGISFALFGEVSGNVREKDSLRSDFAAADKMTRAELTFLHKNRQYRVIRNPRYDRPKLRGEGTTTEQEAGEFYEEGKLLATGSQQVTDAVSTLLGLNYRQFKQISMIAQGEFQQLLLASSKERTLIFRDIFQTRLYDTISRLLMQRGKRLNARLEEGRHRMEETAGTILMESEQWQQLCQQKNRNYSKMMECIREDLEAKKQERNRLKIAQEKLEREYKNLLQEAERIRQNNRLIDCYHLDLSRLEALKQSLLETKQRSCQLEKEMICLPELEQEAVRQQETVRLLEEQHQKAGEWRAAQETLLHLQKQYLELDTRARQKKQEYEYQEDLSKKAAAGVLAQTLQAGIPCPVCGSLTHPAPAQMAAEIPGEQQLKALKQESDVWMERSALAQAKAASASGALAQMEQHLGGWRETLMTDAGEVLCLIKRQLDEHKMNQERLQHRMNHLRQEWQEIRLREEKHKAAYEQAKESLRKPKDLNRQDSGDWNDRIQETERERKQLIREGERLQTIFSINRAGLMQLEEHGNKRMEAEAEYGVLMRLERAATGSNHKKLVLEQYVLSVYFEEILRAANLRLGAMTGDRYELYRQEESRDKRTKEGMELEVLDQYTGKRRSVKTLSGGEVFKAALALALGTSDVVQSYAGGIQVETLFIDEGFGALDGESLGQAVDNLWSLSGGQRMVGIISHVEELRERIENQILVEKNNNGSSIRTNFKVYSM